MIQQEPLGKQTKTLVRIPEIKRYQKPVNSLNKDLQDYFFFNFQTPFEVLRSQIQDLKSELELKPDKSDFTRVFSNQDESIANTKFFNCQSLETFERTQIYQKQLIKLIQAFENHEVLTTNEKKDFSFNTKNILRNICNAQNQFILFHPSAQKIIQDHLQNSERFKKWVNGLRFHTFEEFQKVWSIQSKGIYFKLYKKLCRKFYIENAIPYLMNSRIRNEKTKLSHIRYLHRFLQGLQNPSQFFYFKKKEKDQEE